MTDNNRTPAPAPAWLNDVIQQNADGYAYRGEKVYFHAELEKIIQAVLQRYEAERPQSQPAELPPAPDWVYRTAPVPVLQPMETAPRDGSFILIQHDVPLGNPGEINISLCQWGKNGNWLYNQIDGTHVLQERFAHGWIPRPIMPEQSS